jgi:hypothetical protein
MSEDDGIVMQLVTRCVDKRDPISPSQAANPLELLSVFLKFCGVALAEFLPAIGIVGPPSVAICS